MRRLTIPLVLVVAITATTAFMVRPTRTLASSAREV